MVRPMSEPTGVGDDSDRGQAYVLGAVGAGIIVLSAVIFAIQATAVTPLSVSTASQHVENQERALADTALTQAAENGTLRAAVLYWNPENRTFVDATAQGYLGRTPDNAFGRQLERVFNDEQIAVNVYVGFSEGNASVQKEMIFQGNPSDNAVSASQTLVLMDRDNLQGPRSNETLNGTNPTDDFYVEEDVAPNGSVYNVVEVRIIAWRM